MAKVDKISDRQTKIQINFTLEGSKADICKPVSPLDCKPVRLLAS